MTAQDGGQRSTDVEPEATTDDPSADDSSADETDELATDDGAVDETEADDSEAGDTDEADTVTEEADEAVAEEEPVLDPVEEMRAALRRAPGDWYVVHSYAGYENKVKTNLETRIQTLDVEDYIFQVEVPTEEVTEIKNGQRKQVQRKVLPGYILVRMDLNDQSWGAVRNTPG